LLLVYSSSSALGLVRADNNDLFYLQSQLVRGLFGAGALFVLLRLDARFLAGRARWFAWGAALALLLVLLLPWGPGVEVRGARRWMRLGSIAFQPSEFARLGMILALAGALAQGRARLHSWRGVLMPAAIVLVTAGLIAAQPHLSLGLLTAAGGFLLIFLAGACLWRLILVALGVLGGAAALALIKGGSYQLTRVTGFLSAMHGDPAFQAKQSLLAIGSGGLWGRGLGQGLQKYFFLPDPHTDFILSILVEEMGFLGLLALFLLMGFIVLRVFVLGQRCASRFSALLCYGVALQMLLAFILHSAVCLGWAPTTGVPFPLVSFGGSALVANLIGLGLVLSVSGREVHLQRSRPLGNGRLLLREPAMGRGRS
jgi:cell division protein FtsW